MNLTRRGPSSATPPPKLPFGAKLAATALGAALIALSPGVRAAATAGPVTATPGDPWEPVNRSSYALEGVLDRHVIRPLGRLYRWLTPGPIGRGVHNVIVNLSEPRTFFNDAMQLRVKRAVVPAARFVTNSTIGLLGLFDVASRAGLVHHDNEFAVTLGKAGVKAGPYLYLPLLGPSSVRDLVGSGVDFLIDPMHWVGAVNRPTIRTTRIVVSGLDLEVTTEADLDALLSTAVDPYATLRSVYLQNMQGEIDGGGIPSDLPSFDEPEGGPAPKPPAPPIPPDPTAPPAVDPGP